ncbi:MAG: DUF5615 family PIN-like protein [Vicinamibacterales bacterium]
MKWLVDNALSPAIVDLLAAAGHDAVHVRALGLQTASDSVVLQAAADQGRVLVSADTEFVGSGQTGPRSPKPATARF